MLCCRSIVAKLNILTHFKLSVSELAKRKESKLVGVAKSSVNLNESRMKQNDNDNSDLIPGSKKKAAILLAYCGENFYGMQMNRSDRSLRTIERELFQGLVAARVVRANCWDDPKKMSFRSASRTDKGVSTCGQVVSLKMVMNENAVELLNNKLPSDIRVLGVRQTTQGFNSQIFADGRTYIYTLPTFAFSELAKESESYRITEDKLAKINSIIYRLKGTHTFHNFTSGKKMGDDSAKRYIIDFNFEKQFLHENMEFMSFRIQGQSFMIHQIRKMMGLIIAMVSGYANEEYYVRAFSSPLEDIPKAPGTGLVLEKVHYDKYNRKFGKLHGGLDFEETADKRKMFMMERIMPYIYKQEIENRCMRNWLDTLENHDYTGETSKIQWKSQCEMNKKKIENKEGNSEADDCEGIIKEEKLKPDVSESAKSKNKNSANSENVEPEKDPDEPSLKKIKL